MTYATDPVPDFCWKCRVSATGEVILTPRISLFSCDSFTKTPEPLLVQTAFTKSVIESPDEGILGLFVQLNEMQHQLGFQAPEQHRLVSMTLTHHG